MNLQVTRPDRRELAHFSAVRSMDFVAAPGRSMIANTLCPDTQGRSSDDLFRTPYLVGRPWSDTSGPPAFCPRARRAGLSAD